jgi:hypothetical protein
LKLHRAIGLMDVAFDDADLLVTLKIHSDESQKVCEMLREPIEEARKQPARED